MTFYLVTATNAVLKETRAYHIKEQTADGAWCAAHEAICDEFQMASDWEIAEPVFDKERGFSFFNKRATAIN